MTPHIQKILISACLLGQEVRYDGGHCLQLSHCLQRWREEGRLIAICPEMAGGLPAPRPPAEISGGLATKVWSGQSPVLTLEGRDVTEAFLGGARSALTLAQNHQIRMAILKEKSPSCGVHLIHDGTFQGRTIPGMGVTAAVLSQNGIRVFSENDIEKAEAYLRTLEDG